LHWPWSLSATIDIFISPLLRHAQEEGVTRDRSWSRGTSEWVSEWVSFMETAKTKPTMWLNVSSFESYFKGAKKAKRTQIPRQDPKKMQIGTEKQGKKRIVKGFTQKQHWGHSTVDGTRSTERIDQ
jgi:hypothetical protein